MLERRTNNLPKVVVGGLIYQNKKILICQRKEDGDHPLKWEFPGGKLKNYENNQEALKRELKEETQLELPHEPKFLYKVERPIEKGGNFMYVFHYLSDHELTPTLDHEHTDFGYYQKDEMPEDIYYLRKYLK